MADGYKADKGTVSSVGKQDAWIVPQEFAQFAPPKEQVEARPTTLADLFGNIKTSAGDKKEKKSESTGEGRFRAMTGAKGTPGGSNAALAVLASIYDDPALQMFIRANSARKY